MLLGIDLGTSSIKSGLFRDDGKLLAIGRSAISAFRSPQPGWAESDPALWWKGVVLSLNAACKESGIEASEIDAIGLSVFFPAVIPLDADGTPLYPALLYNDQRSSSQVSSILKKVDKEDYERRIGNTFMPGTCAISSIQWLREVKPEIYQRTQIIGFANTYLVHKFTGEFFTDPSNAALSGLADINNPWEWSKYLCQRFSIDTGILPTIAGSYQVVGAVSKQCAGEIGIKSGIPVVVGCGDAVASSFGAGALRFGTVVYIGGSSDCVTMPLVKPCSDHRWINDAYISRGSWLGIGTVTSSGTALDWFDREILDTSREGGHKLLASLASSAKENTDGPLFLPYLQGERTPVWDPHARGAFFGISAATTRHDLARAVLTGTALALRDVIECLEEIHGISIEEVRAVGGSTSNELWNQIKANALQKSLQVLDFKETASLGAAMLSGVGIGVYCSLQEANRHVREISTAKTIEPIHEMKPYYDESFHLYKQLYAQTKWLMREKTRHSSRSC
jgi:xylulokinase